MGAAEANKAAGSQKDIMRWTTAILLLCGVFAAYATSVENPTVEGVKKDVAVEDNATLKLVESKPEEKVADAPVEPVKEEAKGEEEEEKEEEEKDIQTKEDIPKEVEGDVVDDEESEQSDPRTLVRHIFKASICEHGKVNLKCRNGLIQIVSANYGRTSRGICRKSFSMWNSNCRSHRSDFQVKKQCNKKRNCKLFASNSVFGDPCRGTYKYLEVRFRCVRHVRKVVVRKKIVHTVHVHHVIGDESKPEEKVADNPVEPVTEEEKKEEVEEEKEEDEKDIQTDEDIPREMEGDVADDEESEQSDPRALVRHTFKASICENHKVNLKCRNGLIQIVSANYGRTSRGVCRKTFSMWNSNC